MALVTLECRMDEGDGMIVSRDRVDSAEARQIIFESLRFHRAEDSSRVHIYRDAENRRVFNVEVDNGRGFGWDDFVTFRIL